MKMDTLALLITLILIALIALVLIGNSPIGLITGGTVKDPATMYLCNFANYTGSGDAPKEVLAPWITPLSQIEAENCPDLLNTAREKAVSNCDVKMDNFECPKDCSDKRKIQNGNYFDESCTASFYKPSGQSDAYFIVVARASTSCTVECWGPQLVSG